MFALMISAAPSTFLLNCELQKIVSSTPYQFNCAELFGFYKNKLCKQTSCTNIIPQSFFLKSESVCEW